jgi:Na+-driven multidrug efflux pump
MGAGNLQRATRVTWLGAGTSFATLSVVGLVAYVFAPALVAFFVPRAPDVIAEGAQFIRIMCLTWAASACSSACCPPFAPPATCWRRW